MQQIFRKIIIGFFCLVLSTTLCGCRDTTNDPGTSNAQTASFGEGVGMQMQQNSSYDDYTGEPYAVRTILREYTALDPDKGVGAYGRYTELIVEGSAPDTFRNAVQECNKRAEESVKARADKLLEEKGKSKSKKEEYQYVTYGYIALVTRADSTAFSFLETEFENGPEKGNYDITYQFRGATFDTGTGEEVALADLVGDEEACLQKLRAALSFKYGADDLVSTAPEGYAWTADALGIRFYFNVNEEVQKKRRETGDYSSRVMSVSFPYTELTGEKVEILSAAPEAYIAMIERETVYDLPYGDVSILLTEKDDDVVIRILKDNGETSDLIIEYADDISDFYIMRAEGGFYLCRERIGSQEGFFYDFSRPDGGYGRFAYNTAQYFDNFLREIQLAVPYNPYCVHMAEVRRSFGENSYDACSFIPHGHYSFPSDPEARYKRYVLRDSGLQIDSNNVACRLLEDLPATEIDAEGNEIGEITVPAGRILFFESVRGEAARYNDPRKRSEHVTSYYDCRVSDGTRVRLTSNTESTMSTEKGYLNRFTEPVSLAEAQFVEAETAVSAPETFYVKIGGKEYPLISDYSKHNHIGEEIDFGEDVWWLVEQYPGRYVSTDQDKEEMRESYFTQEALGHPEETAELMISEDGEVVFDFFGERFIGNLPKKRYYKMDVAVSMESERENRTFRIILREGKDHTAPTKIEFYSEGLPATNEPSTMPPVSVYLTKE